MAAKAATQACWTLQTLIDKRQLFGFLRILAIEYTQWVAWVAAFAAMTKMGK
jgi:hypothetical protein